MITLRQGATTLPVLIVLDATLHRPLARQVFDTMTGGVVVNELPPGPMRGSFVLAMHDLPAAVAAANLYASSGPVTLSHPTVLAPLTSLTHLALGEARIAVLNAGSQPEHWTVTVDWVQS